jgi:signal transduction histidine kinase/CheY-like chemotaxis protein
MFVRNTPSVCVFATLFGCLLAIYLRQQMDAALVYWWLGIKILVVVPRIAHAYILEKRDTAHLPTSQRWALGLLFLDGLWWGMAGPMFLPGLDVQTSTILGCALMGIVSVATFTLHVHAQAMVLYCTPILLPSVFIFFSQGNSFGFFMALSQALFLIGLMSVSKKAHSHATEMLWRRFSMDRILKEKESALREAARQDTIKSQFVATMSHELRTPLHGILGLTRMLSNRHTEIDTRHQLGLVERAGEHLLMLINRVLDFSRIEAGYLAVDVKPFDLHTLLTDTMHLTAITAQDKDLGLTYHFQMAAPTWVEGDASKFKQVLLNLIGNAIKFTNIGSIHIIASHTPETGLTTVRVQDSGIGIPLKDLPTIFEPYKQAQSVAGGPIGGTGLGLTISREISRAMEGDITCESREGKGSTFTFTSVLPTWTPDLDTNFDALRPLQVTQQTTADAAKLSGHVLLAEDNEINALIVDLQLQRKGLTVEHVKNGQEALERLLRIDQPRPDVVLMDCQMPLVDGFEATRRLRTHEKQQGLSRLPVIALTASAMAEDSTRCLNSGMDAHLSKPFNEDQLFALLIAYLKPQQPAFH